MRRRLALVGMAVAGLLLASCGEEAAPTLEVVGDEAEMVDYDYTIPFGTQRRIASGENIEIMPDRLEVKVGETIRITNEDKAGAFVGIFFVGAGETVSMRFTTPGELTGKCEVNASGEFTIDVQPA